jgi:hypothetical protein
MILIFLTFTGAIIFFLWRGVGAIRHHRLETRSGLVEGPLAVAGGAFFIVMAAILLAVLVAIASSQKGNG